MLGLCCPSISYIHYCSLPELRGVLEHPEHPPWICHWVRPHDRHLLGMQWDGSLYVDTVLPFGLRSSPKIFNCIANALQWIAKRWGISYLDYYLDDFITACAVMKSIATVSILVKKGQNQSVNKPSSRTCYRHNSKTSRESIKNPL